MTALANPAAKNTAARPTEGTQAIRRALAVMETFMQGDPDLSISQIAEALGLSPSTIHRIVRALVSHGFLHQDEMTDRYYLGRSAVRLGQVAQHIFALERVVPILNDLASSTGESVNLGVREGNHAMVLFRVESTHPLRFDEPPGTLVPLHCSAMGKVLLAFSPDPETEISRLPALKRNTPNTTTSKAALLEDVKGVLRRGFSIDNEESFHGARCVGAPIVDRSGHARGAIAVQAPAIRLSVREAKALGSDVVKAAQQISDVIPADRKI